MEPAVNCSLEGLSQLCASFDKGGGVAIRDTFTIYSIVASPPNWVRTKSLCGTQAKLISAASAVRNVIPIIFAADVHAADIVSLPCLTHPTSESAQDATPQNTLPWFLINASKFPKHQIVGHGEITESLLRILQRPWCVLELCCSEIAALSAIYQFVIVATKLYPNIYDHVLGLLYYELNRRTVLSFDHLEIPESSPATGHRTFNEFGRTWAVIQKAYANSCHSRLPTHNSFWLRLISTCALYLGISCSHLVRALSGIPSEGVHFQGQEHAQNKTYHEGNGQVKAQSFAPAAFSTCKSVAFKRRSTSGLGDSCMAISISVITSNDPKHLLLVYRHVLRMISDHLP